MINKSRNNTSRVLVAMSAIAFIFIVGISISKGTYSNSIFDNCLFIGDSRYAKYVGIAIELESLGSNIAVRAVSGSTVSEWENVVKNGSGTVGVGTSHATSITLPSSASCVSVMLGANSSNQASITKMKEIMQILHNRYPNAKIVFNSIYHLGANYTYADKDYVNKTYDTFNAEMKSFCNSNNWTAYVDVTSGIHDANGYLKYPDDSGIHLVGEGKTILKQNIQTQVGKVISGGSNETSTETPGNDDGGKITLQSSSNYPWNDGSSNNKTISCNNTTYLSEINTWLKNSPDVWWCNTSKTIKEYFDNAECGMTFSPCAKPGSNQTNTETPTDDTLQPADDSVPFDDVVNGDRCYNGTWVRVMECQKNSIANAQCKLSNGSLVLRKGGDLTTGDGCADLLEPYTDSIDDYRCNKDTGRWIYISSCQSRDLIGAKCKTSDGMIIRTYLTYGTGCNEADDDADMVNNGVDNGNEVSNNPFTGTIELIISMIIAFGALIFSGYYYRKNKLLNDKYYN